MNNTTSLLNVNDEPLIEPTKPTPELTVGAKELSYASHGNIEVQMIGEATPAKNLSIESAQRALNTEMRDANVEVLPDQEQRTAPAPKVEELLSVIEQDTREETPDAEKDPFDTEVKTIQDNISRAAASLKESSYSDATKNELMLALKTLEERVVEVIQQKETANGADTVNALQKLLEESKTLCGTEWTSRFVAPENMAQQEPATEQSAEVWKMMAGAAYKTLEDLQLPIGRVLDEEKKQAFEAEFFALRERMLLVVNADNNATPPEEIEWLFQDIAALEQKVKNYAEQEPVNSAGIEKEREIKTEIEAISRFETLSPEQKRGFWKNVADIGFTVEQKKDEWWAHGFGYLAGNKKIYSPLKRFFVSTKDIFERDAKRAEQNRADLRAGKEARLQIFGKNIADINTLRGSGFLWGNLMKYGRSILGPFAWVNTGLMIASVGLEAAKEARLGNEDVMEKTRVQDIDRAAEEAWRLYEEAKNKAGGGRITQDVLEKTYQENIPKDLLERLAKNAEPGTENGFWQKILQKDMQGTVEKISRELEKIDADQSLSQEARDEQKNAYLNNWFTRSQRLKDYDRIVGQNGEIDTLASFARYGEFTAKTAVYGMMADSMRMLGTKLAEVLSSSDGVEILSSLSPIKSALADEILPDTHHSLVNTEQSANTGGVVSDTQTEHSEVRIPPQTIPGNHAPAAVINENIMETLSPQESAIEKSLVELQKTYTVQDRDTIWSINKNHLGGNEYWNNLTPRQQNLILDTMRHDLLNRPKSEIIAMGIKSGDINRIYPGDKIDFSKIFDEKELLRVFNKAEAMKEAPEAPSTLPIVHHAEKVHHAISATPTEPKQEHLFAPKTIDSPKESLVFEAFLKPTNSVPFDYTQTVFEVITEKRPDVFIPYYEKMSDFLAEHPNGIKELDGIFHIRGVKVPETLTPATKNDRVIDWLARIAWENDIRQGHANVEHTVIEPGQSTLTPAHEIPAENIPVVLENPGNFKTSFELWAILPKEVRDYIVKIDGQIGKNIDPAVWERTRGMSADTALKDASPGSIRDRLLFLQEKADVVHKPTMNAVKNETLEHYIARLARELSFTRQPPEIPKTL